MTGGINLVPDDIRKSWLVIKVRMALIAAGALYLVVLSAVFVQQRHAIGLKRAEAAVATQRMEGLLSGGANYTELASRLQQARLAEADLTKRLSVTAGISRTAWSRVLKKLSHDVPKGVWLRGISTTDAAEAGGKRVRLVGSAVGNKPVADFVFALENSGYFANVTLAYTQKRDIPTGQVYDFELFMGLKRTEETSYAW